MDGRVIVDTNIVIRVFNADSNVKSRIESTDVYLPSIVAGELMFDALKSTRVRENLSTLDDFVSKCSILSVGFATAGIYGHLKQDLRTRGRPIPDNDLWIAALAIEHRLTLVTRDSHFKEIDELQVEFWV